MFCCSVSLLRRIIIATGTPAGFCNKPAYVCKYVLKPLIIRNSVVRDIVLISVSMYAGWVIAVISLLYCNEILLYRRGSLDSSNQVNH